MTRTKPAVKDNGILAAVAGAGCITAIAIAFVADSKPPAPAPKRVAAHAATAEYCDADSTRIDDFIAAGCGDKTPARPEQSKPQLAEKRESAKSDAPITPAMKWWLEFTNKVSDPLAKTATMYERNCDRPLATICSSALDTMIHDALMAHVWLNMNTPPPCLREHANKINGVVVNIHDAYVRVFNGIGYANGGMLPSANALLERASQSLARSKSDLATMRDAFHTAIAECKS